MTVFSLVRSFASSLLRWMQSRMQHGSNRAFGRLFRTPEKRLFYRFNRPPHRHGAGVRVPPRGASSTCVAQDCADDRLGVAEFVEERRNGVPQPVRVQVRHPQAARQAGELVGQQVEMRRGSVGVAHDQAVFVPRGATVPMKLVRTGLVTS